MAHPMEQGARTTAAVRNYGDLVGKAGLVNTDPGRPIGGILAELNATLKRLGIEPQEYGFSNMCDRAGLEIAKMPELNGWIACFPVTGGSEGFYVHIELAHRDGKREMIGLAKTYNWDNACELANAAALLLGA